MADISLSFIGTANAFTPAGLCWNGFIVNERILFEAPPSALMAIRKLGRDPVAIDTVLISHHHGDHFLGLPTLLLEWKYAELTRPVRVIGPRGTYAATKLITEIAYPGVFGDGRPVDWTEIESGESVHLPGMDVEAFPAKHDQRMTCLSFRVRLGGRTVSYTGDSAFCEALIELSKGADVLVAECTSLDRESEVHMNLRDDISRLRTRLAKETRVLLTHLGEEIPTPGLEGVTPAQDLATYTF